MRILVCGGRDFKDEKLVYEVLENPVWFDDDLEIISGMARGADTFAVNFAKEYDIPLLEFPADWDKYKKAAGFIRNQQMLDEGKPDLVIAFPGGAGTADMVRRAKKAGIEVKEIN